MESSRSTPIVMMDMNDAFLLEDGLVHATGETSSRLLEVMAKHHLTSGSRHFTYGPTYYGTKGQPYIDLVLAP
eukprot:5824669-Pyramimonas_sp.AAC.1